MGTSGKMPKMAMKVVCLIAAQPSAALQLSRRDTLASLFSSATLTALGGGALPASASSARTGLSSVFTGEYDDPKHPNCLRSIKVVGAAMGPDGRRRREPAAYVKGVDNAKGTPSCADNPELASVWKLEGKVAESGETIYIDFSPKGGPKDLVGTWDTFGGAPGILFTDGNKWTKVSNGTPQRRPPAVTLSSE